MDVTNNNSELVEESSYTNEDLEELIYNIAVTTSSEEENYEDEEDYVEEESIDNSTSSTESSPEPELYLDENSPTLLIDETVSRFSSAEWFAKMKEQRVSIIGVGGIGSYVAFLMGRVKPGKIHIIDPDIVEAANMSGQLYSNSQVGLHKATAISHTIIEFCNYYDMIVHSQEASPNTLLYNIVMCGLDNMASRKEVFLNWKNALNSYNKEYRRNFLFIDGRLAAEEFQVFCMTGNDTYLIEKYEKEWLFDDSEAEETLCSYKQTSFCANMIASVMVNLFVNFTANLCDTLFPRELPFMTYYNALTMQFKTRMV